MQKKIIAIEGPSGIGKTVLINALVKLDPDKYEKITSYTTRPKRERETDGCTYNFIDEQTFLEKVKSGDIFEHTTRHGTYRGMSKSSIDKIINNNHIGLKDLDIVGIRSLKRAYPDKVFSIFITADKEVIKRRLEKRGEKDMQSRLDDYDNVHKHKNEFDCILENNGSLDEIIKKVQYIIRRDK